MTEKKLPTANKSWGAILPKLLKAQATVDKIQKASKHPKYKYTSAEDMYTYGRDILHEQGLALSRIACTLKDRTQGNEFPHCELEYALYDDKGNFVHLTADYPMYPTSYMPIDKALNASMTSCMSYVIRDLLLIPRCDEEVCARVDKDTGTVTKKTATRTTKTPDKMTQKRTAFMNATAAWANIDPKSKANATNCVGVLGINKCPTDGTATEADYEKCYEWVEENRVNGFVLVDILPREEKLES